MKGFYTSEKAPAFAPQPISSNATGTEGMAFCGLASILSHHAFSSIISKGAGNGLGFGDGDGKRDGMVVSTGDANDKSSTLLAASQAQRDQHVAPRLVGDVLRRADIEAGRPAAFPGLVMCHLIVRPTMIFDTISIIDLFHFP